jgi:uncharacterized membrane protein YozB (DUF420 family)
MLVNCLKFLHLLCVLSLFGTLIYGFVCISRKNISAIISIHQVIIVISLLAMLTGTFLVHPKHFTFHTPWIKAAYLLLITFCIGITLLKNRAAKIKPASFSSRQRMAWQITYVILGSVLILITHDAVTKTTLSLFSYAVPELTRIA